MIDPQLISPNAYTESFVPRQIFAAARGLYEREEFESAVALLRSALERVSDRAFDGVPVAEAWALLGRNYLALRAWKNLENLYDHLHSCQPDMRPEFEILLAWEHAKKEEFHEAIGRADAFLDAVKPGLHPLHPDFLMIRGYCCSRLGAAAEPEQDCEAAYVMFRVQERRYEAAQAANMLGLHLLRLSRYSDSVKWLTRAHRIYEEMGLARKESQVALNRGIVSYKLGDIATAQETLNQSLALAVEGGWVHRQCFANIALGNVYRMQREFRSARRHLTAGYNQAQELRQSREEALALEFLGDVVQDEGRHEEALRYYSRALTLAESLAPDGDIVAEVHRRIGECHVLGGAVEAAAPHLERAIVSCRLLEDRFEEAVTLRVLADAARVAGDLTLASGRIRKAIGILAEIGAEYELGVARFRYAAILAGGRDAAPDLPALRRLNQAWREATDSLKYFLQADDSWWIKQVGGLVNRIQSLRTEQEGLERRRAAAGRKREQESGLASDPIVYVSRAMEQVLDLCDLYAMNDNPVLIHGETGTGKELLARRLHEMSVRSGRLISVNVSAVSPMLFEREFFGHVRGAFSGADTSGVGFAEQADGGTLFLDEIGEMPLELQPKLLRLLQDGTFHAVGDPSERRVDLRLVAATNVDLFEACRRGAFREDLYYRLQVLALSVPPLRERPEDVPPLMVHFLSRAAGRVIEIGEYLSAAGTRIARQYEWPGNVREVQAVCQQLHVQIVTTGSGCVRLGRRESMVLCGPGDVVPEEREIDALGAITDPQERLSAALERAEGNRTKAARLLNVSRSTLYRQLRRNEAHDE